VDVVMLAEGCCGGFVLEVVEQWSGIQKSDSGDA